MYTMRNALAVEHSIKLLNETAWIDRSHFVQLLRLRPGLAVIGFDISAAAGCIHETR